MPQYKLPDIFELESGEFLNGAHLYYEVLGNPENEPIWICHALTGSTAVKDWWPSLFAENGGFLDPKKHFIVCANSLGSCYGSTGPAEEDKTFPNISHRDVVKAFHLLKEHLGIKSISMLMGGSLGGQQALEWSILYPNEIERLVLIGCNAKHSAWGIAWNHLQREAIANADNEKGLALARSIAMLSYRSPQDFENKEQSWQHDTRENVASYLNYQGEKFIKRFDEQSYVLLSKMMDAHDISRDREDSIETILGAIEANSLVIGIDNDLLFPITEQQYLAEHIPGAHIHVISSPKGHDAFLLEGNRISQAIEQNFKLALLD